MLTFEQKLDLIKTATTLGQFRSYLSMLPEISGNMRRPFARSGGTVNYLMRNLGGRGLETFSPDMPLFEALKKVKKHYSLADLVPGPGGDKLVSRQLLAPPQSGVTIFGKGTGF